MAGWRDATPVLVGVGEVTERTDDPGDGREPLALMAEALRRADADAGGGWLARLDTLNVVNSVSWSTVDPVARLCSLIDAAPRTRTYGEVGGETPIRFLNEAAGRIASGEAEVAAIVGAEAADTVLRASRSGIALPWSPAGPPRRRLDFKALFHRAVVANGLTTPLIVYPFYEAASAAAWGQSPAEATAESAALWSRFAASAEQNPAAWIRRGASVQEIAEPTPSNRRVAGPYTKLMVANPNVNQGAALILTRHDLAKAAGVGDDRLVFVLGGAGADEPRDFTRRNAYHHSTAMDATLQAAQRVAEDNGDALEHLELYSCFPCVPKMARRTLGLGADVEPTVTGGLTFFGAPLNDYMTHAAAAMVRWLRQADGAGLLYGQGEFVTKHQTAVLSRTPPRRPFAIDADAQAVADARRGPVPPIDQDRRGAAEVETYTVGYARSGEPEFAVVFARAGEARVVARCDADDPATLAAFAAPDDWPIGRTGRLEECGTGTPRFAL
ncbi:acetyl-CoA acetyltransferase [Acuticoccus sp.]|uniref:acetyl-CoA acetyltransferase n=1 Tax=Acuticoccus sp. TaxID=1904378 RepID=UPI003B521CEC